MATRTIYVAADITIMAANGAVNVTNYQQSEGNYHVGARIGVVTEEKSVTLGSRWREAASDYRHLHRFGHSLRLVGRGQLGYHLLHLADNGYLAEVQPGRDLPVVGAGGKLAQ